MRPPLEIPLYTLQADAGQEVGAVLAWSGAAASASFELAASGQLAFRRASANELHRLGPDRELWLKLRVQARDAQHAWFLTVPFPVVDAVTVYQRDEHGQWHSRMAGDTVPLSRWPQPGRYPAFRLQVAERGATDVLVRVQHATSVTLPIRLATADAHHQRMQFEYLVLGMALGALALLTIHSLVRAGRLRDSAYGWYTAYALMSALALAAFTGVAAHVLWPDSGAWIDAAPGCVALLAGSIAILVTGHLSSVTTRTRRLGRAMQVVGWGGMAAAPLYLFLERQHGVVLLAADLLTVALLSLAAAVITWRRGDPVGRWMLWGALPLALSVLIALARVFNWIEVSWLTEYALVLALTINLPTLYGALNSRSQERRGAQLRQLAAASQDPLTGLLKAQPFLARLEQSLQRFHRRGEGAAIAIVELSNYGWIKSQRGAEVAEEALLRAVIKLRRQVRDVDTTGRLGEARFGLILEGVSSPDVVRERATRLIAAGLMEEPERPQDVVLHFHVVANLLTQYAPAPAELLLGLQRTLSGMHGRTRRAFRMLDPHDLPGGPTSSGGFETSQGEAPESQPPPSAPGKAPLPMAADETEDSGPPTMVEPREPAGGTA